MPSRSVSLSRSTFPTADVPQSAGGPSDSVKARRKAYRQAQAPWSKSPRDGSCPDRSGSRASRRIHLASRAESESDIVADLRHM